MDDEKVVDSPEVVEPGTPAKSEADAVSRRAFMRRSAEVAALSLFGVLGLDAVADKVLERMAENQAIGRLSDAAASALKKHRLDHYAEASVGCTACTHCDRGYLCPSNVACGEFSPAGCDTDETPYGCWERKVKCTLSFSCSVVNCDQQAGKYDCAPHDCVPLDNFNCSKPYAPCGEQYAP